jgi:hypothetical protein
MRTMLGVDIGLPKASRKCRRVTDNVEAPILTTSLVATTCSKKPKRMVSLIYDCFLFIQKATHGQKPSNIEAY